MKGGNFMNEQTIQRIVQIMHISYNLGDDQLDTMLEQSRLLAEQMVRIFGENVISKMEDSDILKLSALSDSGYSLGFRAGYNHAKKSMNQTDINDTILAEDNPKTR